MKDGTSVIDRNPRDFDIPYWHCRAVQVNNWLDRPIFSYYHIIMLY